MIGIRFSRQRTAKNPADSGVSASDGARGNGSPPERACSAKPVATIITLSNSKPAGKIVSRNH